MHATGQKAAHALLDVGLGVDLAVAIGALLDDHTQEVDVAGCLLCECEALSQGLDEALLELGAWRGRHQQVVDVHDEVQHSETGFREPSPKCSPTTQLQSSWVSRDNSPGSLSSDSRSRDNLIEILRENLIFWLCTTAAFVLLTKHGSGNIV